MAIVFGKRTQIPAQKLPPQVVTTSNWGPSAAPQVAPTDADGISRIFPKELFTGEIGAFLHSVGLSPDMPGNIAQTDDTFRTLDVRARNTLAQFVNVLDKTNRRLSAGLGLKPFFLVPESMWQGKYRNFLCATCQFYPANPTNVFFLAGTQLAAQKFRLPLRVKASAQEGHANAENLVFCLADHYQQRRQSGITEAQAGREAAELARAIGTAMSVLMFDTAHADQERKLFGPLAHRNYAESLAQGR